MAGTAVFDGRPSLGLLSVVFDDAGLDGGPTPVDSLVRGLCSSPLITSWRWDGTTRDLDREELDSRALADPGTVHVGPLSEGVRQVARASSKETVMGSGIAGNSPDVAATDVGSASYAGLVEADRAQRRRDDALADGVADAVDADLLITRREYLLEGRLGTGSAMAATPEEALPLIGLYLRTQGKFTTDCSADGSFTRNLDRDLFFLVGTRQLLPASWRWYSACVQSATRNGAAVQPDEVAYVALSTLVRVQRALEARDRVLVALNRTQDYASRSEALSNLDFLLLSLMGALDAAARVTHTVLGLPDSDLFQAGWQKKSWVKSVRNAESALGAVTRVPGHQEVVAIIADLRNTIHGASLKADIFKVGAVGAGQQLLIILDAGTKAAQQMKSSPDRDAWGLQEYRGVLLLDPASFIDHALLTAARFLDDVMTATPVEQLPGVTQPDSGPPNEQGLYDQRTRENVLALLGLS